MFSNFQDILKALQSGILDPGAMGGQMPAVTPGGDVKLPPSDVQVPQTFNPPPQANVPVPQARPDPMQTASVPAPGGMLAPETPAAKPEGASAFGGLLKFKDEDSKQAALRGLLGASASLMAAGGPSDHPTSFLGNLGGAIANGVGAYDGYKDGLTDRAAKAAQTERYKVANAQDQFKIEQAQKAEAARQRLFGGAGFDGGSNTGATAGPVAASGSPVAAAPTNDLAGQINTQRATYQRQYNGLMTIGEDESARQIFSQMNYLDNEAAKQGLIWDGSKYTAAPGFNEGAQGLKQAEATGTSLGNRNAWTDDQKELNQVNSERAAKGLPPLGMEEYSTSQKRAGATTVNVGEGNKVGSIPEGYMLSTKPDPNNPGATLTSMVPIPGGPAELKAQQTAAAKENKDAHKDVSSDAVDTAFNNVLRVRNDSTLPTNGFFGGMLSHVGGTGSNDMRAALETLKANASLSTLQKMRDESPTGAGMGNPTKEEQEMIQASLATLDSSQSNAEFIRNLNNFRNLWMDLVHGAGNGPARHPVDYGLQPLTQDELAAGERPITPQAQTPTAAPVQIKGVDDFQQLPRGTVYLDPQGVKRIKQ